MTQTASTVSERGPAGGGSAPGSAPEAPLFPGLPWIGSLLELRRDNIDFLSEVAAVGDVVELRFIHARYYLVNSPEAVHHILVDNNRNYRKSPNYQGLKLVLGEGLVTSEGEFWRRQRRLSQPAFHRDRVASFVGAMVDETDRMLARWTTRVGEVIDFHAEMMNLTLRIVARTLFSTSVGPEADAIREALGVAIHHANDYAEAVIKPPQWLPLPKNFRFRRSMKTLDSLVFRIIDARRRGENADAADLLALLMAATEDGRGMSDQQLRDEVMTLVMAGHETTANALAWTFYLLSKDPEVERRLRRDVVAAIGERAPDAEDAPRLRYAKMVVEESMRVFPPVWAIERQALEDDVVGGFRLPKRALVAISPFLLHRHRDYWQNPEGFDPERFAPENAEKRPKFAYLPFGGGPRQCIGMGFATIEAQMILARIVQRFRLELVPGHRVEPEPVVTLRPRGGLPMRLRLQAPLGEQPVEARGNPPESEVRAAPPRGCPAHSG
jgi:cytochrome P450